VGEYPTEFYTRNCEWHEAAVRCLARVTVYAHLVVILKARAHVVQDGRGKLHVDRLAAAAHRRKPHQGVPVLPRPFRQRQAIVQVVLVVLAVGMSAKVREVWRIAAATHGA